MRGVYCLHFERPYRHAAHYTGWAADIEARLAEHRSGCGARLTQVVRDAGIEMELACVWPGEGRAFERRLKNRGSARRFCPICKAKRKEVAR